MKNRAVQIGAADSSRGRRIRGGAQETQASELSGLLQTTLQINELVALFSRAVKRWIPHSGYRYQHDEQNILLEGGKQGGHQCQYTLTLHKTGLGTLTLMRSKRYSEDDLRSIESQLCHLVYPLRNALLYQDALRSAQTDGLTGLSNRLAFDAAFQREYKLACRHDSPLSMLLLDLDHFKLINDNYGHHIGDRALRSVAAILKESVRNTDMVFRFGGEEFVVLLANTPDLGAAYLAERVRAAIQNLSFKIGRIAVPITVSIGVATLNGSERCEEFLSRADQAMYAAKQLGRNRVTIAEPTAEIRIDGDGYSLSTQGRKAHPLRQTLACRN